MSPISTWWVEAGRRIPERGKERIYPGLLDDKKREDILSLPGIAGRFSFRGNPFFTSIDRMCKKFISRLRSCQLDPSTLPHRISSLTSYRTNTIRSGITCFLEMLFLDFPSEYNTSKAAILARKWGNLWQAFFPLTTL